MAAQWSHCGLAAASARAEFRVLLDTGELAPRLGAGRLEEVVHSVLALHRRNLGQIIVLRNRRALKTTPSAEEIIQFVSFFLPLGKALVPEYFLQK